MAELQHREDVFVECSSSKGWKAYRVRIRGNEMAFLGGTELRRVAVRQRQFSCSGVCGALQSKRLGIEIENPRCELRSSWHDFYLCHAARETETVAAARRRNGLRLRLEPRRGRGSAAEREKERRAKRIREAR